MSINFGNTDKNTSDLSAKQNSSIGNNTEFYNRRLQALKDKYIGKKIHILADQYTKPIDGSCEFTIGSKQRNDGVKLWLNPNVGQGYDFSAFYTIIDITHFNNTSYTLSVAKSPEQVSYEYVPFLDKYGVPCVSIQSDSNAINQGHIINTVNFEDFKKENSESSIISDLEMKIKKLLDKKKQYDEHMINREGEEQRIKNQKIEYGKGFYSKFDILPFSIKSIHDKIHLIQCAQQDGKKITVKGECIDGIYVIEEIDNIDYDGLIIDNSNGMRGDNQVYVSLLPNGRYMIGFHLNGDVYEMYNAYGDKIDHIKISDDTRQGIKENWNVMKQVYEKKLTKKIDPPFSIKSTKTSKELCQEAILYFDKQGKTISNINSFVYLFSIFITTLRNGLGLKNTYINKKFLNEQYFSDLMLRKFGIQISFSELAKLFQSDDTISNQADVDNTSIEHQKMLLQNTEITRISAHKERDEFKKHISAISGLLNLTNYYQSFIMNNFIKDSSIAFAGLSDKIVQAPSLIDHFGGEKKYKAENRKHLSAVFRQLSDDAKEYFLNFCKVNGNDLNSLEGRAKKRYSDQEKGSFIQKFDSYGRDYSNYKDECAQYAYFIIPNNIEKIRNAAMLMQKHAKEYDKIIQYLPEKERIPLNNPLYPLDWLDRDQEKALAYLLVTKFPSISWINKKDYSIIQTENDKSSRSLEQNIALLQEKLNS